MDYKVICINLERRPDRKKNMIDLFQQNNLSVEFFPAVDGLKIQNSDPIRKLFKGNIFNNRPGVMGCALSHYYIWKNLFEDKKYNQYIILEDDIKLAPNFVDKLNYILNHLFEISGHDLILLGHHIPVTNFKYKTSSRQDNPIKFQKFNTYVSIGGAFGYIINKEGANKLIKYINTYGIRIPIDDIMFKLVSLKIYEIFPHIIYSEYVNGGDGVDTDIQIKPNKKTIII